MVKCCAAMCDSSSHKKVPGITFHRFPKNDQLKNEWINNLRVHSCLPHNWKPKYSTLLCSRHFESRYLDPSAFCTRLRPGAIPSIFEESQEPEITVKTEEPVTQVVQNPLYIKSEIQQDHDYLSGPLNNGAPNAQDPIYITSEIQQDDENLARPTNNEAPIQNQINIKSDIQQDVENLAGSSNNEDEEEPIEQLFISDPIKSETVIRKLNMRIKKKNAKIKALRQNIFRLKKKVSKFSNLISDLKSKIKHEDIHNMIIVI